jgi:hypothetical protein
MVYRNINVQIFLLPKMKQVILPGYTIIHHQLFFMKKLFLPVIVILCCILLFSGCRKSGKSSNTKFSFDVYPNCTTPSGYAGRDVDVSITSFGFQISGNTGTDEVGINFYGTPVIGTTYDLGAITPFNVDVYWDPGDNGVDEYGSQSGQATVVDLKVENNVIQRMEVTFDNITAINAPGGVPICIKSGLILFERN